MATCQFHVFDSFSGQQLDPYVVRKAGEDERGGVLEHWVIIKTRVRKCWGKTGVPPVSMRWVDHNRVDTQDPDMRSRWVGRDFKGRDTGRDDLLAAAPPREAKKTLIPRAASHQGFPGTNKKNSVAWM